MKCLATGCVGFRAMGEGDLDQVLRIERAAYPFPWTRRNFQDCIKAGYKCLILTLDGMPAGHGVLSSAVGEAHILNLCVAPAHQGKGLGRGLLEHLLNLAASLGADTAFLEVRASNHVALGLYQRVGFNEIGLRANYYPSGGRREDAIILALTLLQ